MSRTGQSEVLPLSWSLDFTSYPSFPQWELPTDVAFERVGVETTWAACVTSTRSDLDITFQILAGGCGDLLILQLPQTSLIGYVPLLITPARDQSWWSASSSVSPWPPRMGPVSDFTREHPKAVS